MHGPFDLRIEELELPPLQPNQILIKLKACGICPVRRGVLRRPVRRGPL